MGHIFAIKNYNKVSVQIIKAIHKSNILGQFFHHFRKISTIKYFPMKSFKEGMTVNSTCIYASVDPHYYKNESTPPKKTQIFDHFQGFVTSGKEKNTTIFSKSQTQSSGSKNSQGLIVQPLYTVNELDGQASLITDPPPTSSTTSSIFLKDFLNFLYLIFLYVKKKDK